ncbi:hypothetical protein [Halomonas sp. CKK8]|uniref:bestrophin-like domain n=1 Tax=Halomonas sp. CKK8 TaxID=3036127 RepID=UPI002414F169|nr:hypothetical protein [Halomonas sp. CKK8]WFM72435.1 hypothetical protein P8934_05390 [Halomonas sp. CKK8]
MSFQQILDSLPIGGVFVAFTIFALTVIEVGYRYGYWWQERTHDEKEGPTGMIVGSLLALMAFLLAVAMGMSSDRFDTRRGLVLAEANSIGTTYLRAGYLPEPASSEIRDLLREYVPLRIATDDLADVRVRIARSVELQEKLWSVAEELARATPESDVLALFIDSLNETIDLNETRVTAGIYARVPETIILLLFCGSMLTLGMVGYNAGLIQRRSPITTIVLIALLGAVITLVVDLDRPRDGFLKVSQQPLIDLQEQVGALPPANPPK